MSILFPAKSAGCDLLARGSVVRVYAVWPAIPARGGKGVGTEFCSEFCRVLCSVYFHHDGMKFMEWTSRETSTYPRCIFIVFLNKSWMFLQYGVSESSVDLQCILISSSMNGSERYGSNLKINTRRGRENVSFAAEICSENDWMSFS